MEHGLDAASNLIAAIGGAFVLYALGRRAYVRQRQREELHDIYIRGGILALQAMISRTYAAFQTNFEVVISLLRYMRDYDPSHPRQPTPDLLQESLVDARFPDDLLSSSIMVQSLFQSDAIASLSFQLTARLTLARVHQYEAMAVLRRFLADSSRFGDDPKKFYKVLMVGLVSDKERVAETLWLSDRLGELQNRFFAAHAKYSTFTDLQTALREDPQIQSLLSTIKVRVDKIREDDAGGHAWPPEAATSSDPHRRG